MWGGKHSQSFSPFCDSISADIAAVSLDSSIRSDEDAAEGDIFARDRKTERDEGESAESRRKIGTFRMRKGDGAPDVGEECANAKSSGGKRRTNEQIDVRRSHPGDVD